MKVVHIISSLDPRSGGPAEALRGLAAAQVAHGISVHVMATWSNGFQPQLAADIEAKRVRVTLVGPSRGSLGRHPQLAAEMHKAVAQADVVHVHGVWEEIQHQASRAAFHQVKPIIIRPCGMLDPWSLAQSRLKKWLYMQWRLRTNLKRAAALHFTSQTECDLTRSLNLPTPAIIEPNGLDLQEFTHLPGRGLFRSQWHIEPERPLLLFMSRLHPKKGLDLLLPAFAQLADRRPCLVIAGPDSGGYRATLEAEVARLGLGERVRFTGMLQGSAKISALVDADLFVLPSYQENFGIAVVEALACGTPVVISDQVNIHREIREAGVGGVVPTRAEPLSQEIARWLGDSSLRHEAGKRARAFAHEHYDWHHIAQRWPRHYQQLITSPRIPSGSA